MCLNTGTNAYGYLKSEHEFIDSLGLVLLMRQEDAAIFASVEVIPEIDDSIDIDIRPEDVEMSTFRSSGRADSMLTRLTLQ